MAELTAELGSFWTECAVDCVLSVTDGAASNGETPIVIRVHRFRAANKTLPPLRISVCICVFYITNEMQLIQFSLLLSALYMFRAVFPPIVRSLYNCMCSLGYRHAFQPSTAGVVGFQSNHTGGRQQKSMTIPKGSNPTTPAVDSRKARQYPRVPTQPHRR